MKFSKQAIIDIGITGIAGTLAVTGVDYWLAGVVACSRGLDYVWDKKTIKPQFSLTQEQIEVIDFLASRFDTLCFGDTWHGSPVLQQMITSDDFQNVSEARNGRKIFLEFGELENAKIIQLEDGQITQQEFAEGHSGALFVSKSLERLQTEQLAAAVVKYKDQYRGIDPRIGGEIFSRNATRWAKGINTAVKIFFPRRFPIMFGAIAASFLTYARRGELFKRYLTNDRLTIQNIMKYVASGELCSIAYGAGHFSGEAKNYGGVDMVSGLKNIGRKPVVIYIYSSEFARKRDKRQNQDLDFVLSKNGRPGKIYLYNAKILKMMQGTARLRRREGRINYGRKRRTASLST